MTMLRHPTGNGRLKLIKTTMVRAKFRCDSIKTTSYGREFELNPVISGSPENEAFFKTTPGGKITLLVKNDGVEFEIGKEYYVDFTPL